MLCVYVCFILYNVPVQSLCQRYHSDVGSNRFKGEEDGKREERRGGRCNLSSVNYEAGVATDSPKVCRCLVHILMLYIGVFYDMVWRLY